MEEFSLIVSCYLEVHNFIFEKGEEGGHETCLQFEPVDEHSSAFQASRETFRSQVLRDAERDVRRLQRDLERSTLRDAITARLKELKLRRPRS